MPQMAEASRAAAMSAVRRTLPSLISALTYGWRGSVSSPLGPLAVTTLPSNLTWTPVGMTTGCLPIRLIFFLPDLAEDFAADFLLFGFAVRHDALRSRED